MENTNIVIIIRDMVSKNCLRHFKESTYFMKSFERVSVDELTFELLST